MKLLIITAVFPPVKSGGADYAMRYAEHFARLGHDVSVLTACGATTDVSGYRVMPVVPRWSWRDAFIIESMVRQLEPDVVEIFFTGWMYNDHPMITFAPNVIRRALKGAHICVHVESLGGVRRELSSPVDALVRRFVSQFVGRQYINYEYGTLARDSDSLVFLNERDMEEWTKLCPLVKDKALLAPPPPIMPIAAPLSTDSIARLRKDYGLDPDRPLLAFYGYVYPGKGMETLLQAMARANAGGRECALLVIGGPPEQKVLVRAGQPNYFADLKKLASDLSLGERVRWIGYSQPGSELPSHLLRASDVCVLPFDDGVMLNNSSFSFAAMHGMPIVTTLGEHTESAFVNGENALLVAPKDAERLSTAIFSVVDHKRDREKLSIGALALANERFSWPKMVDRTLRFWKSR